MANQMPSPPSDDSEPAFLLPQLGFFADLEGGIGSVALGEDFFGMELMLQLKILEDWREGLSLAMRHAMVREYRERTADCDLPLPERIAHFKQECSKRGIKLPADFTLMLQQD